MRLPKVSFDPSAALRDYWRKMRGTNPAEEWREDLREYCQVQPLLPNQCEDSWAADTSNLQTRLHKMF